jgi:hypothetical protein
MVDAIFQTLPKAVQQHDPLSLRGRSRDYTIERMAFHDRVLKGDEHPRLDRLWYFLAGDGERTTLAVQSQPKDFATKADIEAWYLNKRNPQAKPDWSTLKQLNSTQTSLEGDVGWLGRMRTTMTWGEVDDGGRPRLTRNEGIMLDPLGKAAVGVAYAFNTLKSWVA